MVRLIIATRSKPTKQVNIAGRYNCWQNKPDLTLTYIKLDMEPIGMNFWSICDLQINASLLMKAYYSTTVQGTSLNAANNQERIGVV